MKAVILAGGLGTRLRPLTNHRPKPVIPLLGQPFLEYQLRWLASYNVTEVALCLHYQAAKVREALGNGSRYGVRLTYFFEETPLGTGGALGNCLAYWSSGTALVLNGDVLTDLNLYAMVDLHVARKAVTTIALAKVSDPTAYGLVVVRPDGKVDRFLEKPGWDQAAGRLINAGVYLMEPGVRCFLERARELSIEREVFPGLLSDGQPVYSYRDPFYWIDIGTPERLMQGHFDLLDRKTIWHLPGSCVGEHAWIEDGAKVDARARLVSPVFIAGNSNVDAGATVGPYAVLGDGAEVGADAEVRYSILMEHARVGPGSTLVRSLLDNGAYAGAGVNLSGLLLAANSRLEGGCRSIHPFEDSGT